MQNTKAAVIIAGNAVVIKNKLSLSLSLSLFMYLLNCL